MPDRNPPPAHPDQQRAVGTNNNKSLLASMIRWLQIKKYQYEVTFSLYMLTPTEKFVFNIIIVTIFSLLVAAAIFYLPNHIAIVSNRLWYYVHGEFLYAATSTTGEAKEGVRRLVSSAGASAMRATQATMSAEEVVRQMHEL